MTRTVVNKWILLGALALPLAACNGGGSGDDDIIVEGPYTHYVTNTLLVPENSNQATEYGLDLDGKEPLRVDNTLGNILSVLAGQGADVQVQIDEAIAAGDIVILHSVQALNFTNAGAGWQVYLGEMPAVAPMFDGTDMFTLDAESPDDARLTGNISGGQF